MSPYQLFYLILSLVVFAFAWLRGGHTERAGVVIFVAAFVASLMLQPLTVNGLRLGEAGADVVFFAAMVWLALRRDRWWTLAAAALGGLTMFAHALMWVTPDLSQAHLRADVIGRAWGIGTAMVLCLAAGVLERWLAGEAPASREARWERPGVGAT